MQTIVQQAASTSVSDNDDVQVTTTTDDPIEEVHTEESSVVSKTRKELEELDDLDV